MISGLPNGSMLLLLFKIFLTTYYYKQQNIKQVTSRDTMCLVNVSKDRLAT